MSRGPLVPRSRPRNEMTGGVALLLSHKTASSKQQTVKTPTTTQQWRQPAPLTCTAMCARAFVRSFVRLCVRLFVCSFVLFVRLCCGDGYFWCLGSIAHSLTATPHESISRPRTDGQQTHSHTHSLTHSLTHRRWKIELGNLKWEMGNLKRKVGKSESRKVLKVEWVSE